MQLSDENAKGDTGRLQKVGGRILDDRNKPADMHRSLSHDHIKLRHMATRYVDKLGSLLDQ